MFSQTWDGFWPRNIVYMNHSIYTELSTEIYENVLRYCIVWIVPYADQWNTQGLRVRQLLQFFAGKLDGRSPIEAISIKDILCVYSQYNSFNIRNVFILSSYHAHCTLLRQCVREYFLKQYDYVGGQMIIDQCVSTVATAQGLENWLVIYSPGLRPLQNRQVGSNSLIDGFHGLYVLSTRAKQHFIYVASMGYMMDNCRTSWPAIRHIQDVTAGPSYNYSSFHIFLILFNKCCSFDADFDSNNNLVLYLYYVFILMWFSCHLKEII